MNSKNKFFIISFILIAIVLISEYPFKKEENTPPSLKEISSLTGFLAGNSITKNDLDSDFECEPDNIKEVTQLENFEIIFTSKKTTFNDVLKRVNIKDANLRFLSFQNQTSNPSFQVAPFEFFSNNFELDLNSGGYCCDQLSKNTEINPGIPILIFSDKQYEICKNPSLDEMTNTPLELNNSGWHLVYVSSTEEIKIPNDKEIESVWSFPLDSSKDSDLVAGKNKEYGIIFGDNFYWYHIVDKTQDSQSNTSTTNQNLETNFNIAMENMSFGFNEIKVPAGQEININLENLDSVPHDFFIQGLNQGSEVLASLESATFTFKIDEPGTYEVICNFHPSMKANIVVE